VNPFRYDKARRIPAIPGYYWARWLTPAKGTHEANENWEIVQVNDNNVEDQKDDAYLSVSVPGVRETQGRENFQWGQFVAPLERSETSHPRRFRAAPGADTSFLREEKTWPAGEK